MTEPEAAIVEGLTARARNLLRALDRQDRLETAAAFVGWLGQEREEGRLRETARELLLRALRTAAEPVNFRILSHLDPVAGVGLPALMESTGLGRVAASEAVHDLVQAGLASREMIDDQIRGTALTTGLVSMVEGISAAASAQLTEQLATSARAHPGEDGDG